MLRVTWFEHATSKSQISRSTKLSYTLLLVLLLLGEHLRLYTSTGNLYIPIGLMSLIIEMLLLSLHYLFIRRCTCRLRGGLFVSFAPSTQCLSVTLPIMNFWLLIVTDMISIWKTLEQHLMSNLHEQRDSFVTDEPSNRETGCCQPRFLPTANLITVYSSSLGAYLPIWMNWVPKERFKLPTYSV